jgi:hypothetical protein
MANPKFFNPADLHIVSNLTLEITNGDITTTYIGYIHPQDTNLVAIRRVERDSTNPNAITGTDYWANGEMYAEHDWADAQILTYLPLKNRYYVS